MPIWYILDLNRGNVKGKITVKEKILNPFSTGKIGELDFWGFKNERQQLEKQVQSLSTWISLESLSNTL